jgi:hypothetical protein
VLSYESDSGAGERGAACPSLVCFSWFREGLNDLFCIVNVNV